MTPEQNNKAGPVISSQTREDLCLYVTNLIRDALFPLTYEERFVVLKAVVDNQAAQPDQPTSEQIEIMISKTIRDQVGRVIANLINDPNSAVSRSIQKNIGPTRQRF